MNEDLNNEVNEISVIGTEVSKKDEFDIALDGVKNLTEVVELYESIKSSVGTDGIDTNYLKYVENTIEDKFFSGASYEGISSKVLIEVICPSIVGIEDFNIEKLDIQTVGNHFEELDNYIDKICVYDGKFISMFGVKEVNADDFIKYEQRKFTRTDMIEAISAQYPENKKIDMCQYDEYYVCTEADRMKVYTERKIVALAKLEDTVFDKIKQKLTSLFSNPFTKKKYLPNLTLVYDTNPNRIKDIEVSSKVNAKSRMKTLLSKERKITRDAAI